MLEGYPIVVDVTSRRIVIVGGGNVALRKVRGLLESGATNVLVISPEFHPDMPVDRVRCVKGLYHSDHLGGASLVFAATDSSVVNGQVVREAQRMGALVCRADSDEEYSGDFTTPAMLRQGPLLLTLSSGGNPALSAMIRDRLARAIDPQWVAMAQLMQALRPELRARLAPARRTEAFRDLCSDPAMQELAGGGVEGLKSWLHGRFPELKD